MSNIKLTITVDDEKLAAIKQFTTEDAPSVEEQLREQFDKIYIKTVPATVRQYIEGKDTARIKSKTDGRKGAAPRGDLG